MKKEIIQTEKGFLSKSPLSQAVKMGNLIFISGQVPVDSKTMQVVSEDFAIQTKHVLDSIKAIVEAAGGSLQRIVKTTVFLTELSSPPNAQRAASGVGFTWSPCPWIMSTTCAGWVPALVR